MKKLIILSTILLFFIPGLYSQLFTTSLKLIEKNDYVNAEKKILKALSQTPSDLEENYAYALLLSKKKYTGYNNEKAYETLNKTISVFDAISDEKEIKKLAKIPITIAEFDKLNDSICLQASEITISKNDLPVYEKFLSFYLNCPSEYKKKVIENRNIFAFNASCKINSVDSYQDFINKYPDAVQFKQAISSRDSLAFLAARKIDNIASFKDFTTRYPGAVQVPQAIERIHELAFASAKKENKASVYQVFIDEYPDSKQNKDAFDLMEKCQFYENTVPGDWLKYAVFTDKFPKSTWVKSAQDSIYKIATQSANLEVLSYCVQNFTGEVRKNALLLYHEVFTMDGEKFTIDMFHAKYKDDFLSEVKSLDYQIVALADELKLGDPYDVLNFTKYDQFIRMAAPRDKALAALQKMITPEIDQKNWTAAQQRISTYASYFGNKNKKFTDLVMFINSQIQP